MDAGSGGGEYGVRGGAIQEIPNITGCIAQLPQDRADTQHPARGESSSEPTLITSNRLTSEEDSYLELHDFRYLLAVSSLFKLDHTYCG